MSNTLNGLTSDIIAQATLPALLPGLAKLQTFSTDFSAEVATSGETVVTRKPGTFTASTWNSEDKYLSSNASTTPISVTMGDPSYVQVEFTPKEAAKIGFDRLRQIFIEPIAHAVVKSMTADALSKIVNDGVLNSNAIVLANASDFDRADVVAIAKKMSGNNLPEMGRSLHLGVDLFYNLIADNTVAQAFSIGGSEVIKNNAIGTLHGLSVYESQQIGDQAYDISSTLKGVAATKSAFMVVSRAPAVQASTYADIASATDPATGFTFTISSWFNQDEGLHKLRCEWLFGTAILEKKAIIPVLVGVID
ncbi:hypothetical protein UFOVP510_22 [uncultured Caudovirales phage]|uniref:Major capsid protein Gp5 n=1 Tax=uncultured Caudovirales phage TaxID=2100421 RepID=A0A6J5MUN4_9CAUD|nr:hypothetical protein UFOVP510_22 [uncultured Caudovirales phage]